MLTHIILWTIAYVVPGLCLVCFCVRFDIKNIFDMEVDWDDNTTRGFTTLFWPIIVGIYTPMLTFTFTVTALGWLSEKACNVFKRED
jgi:hypothetical protein